MSPQGIINTVLQKRAESLLGDALYQFMRQIDHPEMHLSDSDVDFAEFFDGELQDIVLFSAEITFKEQATPGRPPRELTAKISGSARRDGDSWDMGAIDVNDVDIK